MDEISLKDYFDLKIEPIGRRQEQIDESLKDLSHSVLEQSKTLMSMAETSGNHAETLKSLTDTVIKHEARSTGLEDRFEPIQKEFYRKKAIDDYLEKDRLKRFNYRKDLAAKLKIPGVVVGSLAAVISLLSMFSSSIISFLEALSK